MEFKEVVKSRRSCRAFEPDPVPPDQLSSILEAGQWAPSPMNALPWEYIVITDAEVKAQVRKVSEAAKQAVLDGGGPGFAAKYDMGFLEEAPVIIAVVFDPSKNGLGTLFFTWFDPEKMRPVLNIPDSLEIAAVIPIGKPKGEVKAPPRKEPKVHREQFAASE